MDMPFVRDGEPLLAHVPTTEKNPKYKANSVHEYPWSKPPHSLSSHDDESHNISHNFAPNQSVRRNDNKNQEIGNGVREMNKKNGENR